MNKEILKNKVIGKLQKWGNNPEEVKKMVDEHFEYASNTYKKVSSIVECISTISY